MTIAAEPYQAATRLNRIERVLAYIHTHLDQPLLVSELAAKSCWSRWQLQRVFSEQTGMSVAHYVRELKLSDAAKQLLTGQRRIIDIALSCGFTSEANFSRAFRQQYNMTPREYRRRGIMDGIRTPLQITTLTAPQPLWLSVQIKTRPQATLVGDVAPILGLFAPEPDFNDVVPALWQRAYARGVIDLNQPSIGAIDVASADTLQSPLPYLAGQQALGGFQHDTTSWIIPEATYAVITHSGPVSGLPDTLQAFIYAWLPDSGYQCTDGIELEIYPSGYQPHSNSAVMTYWVPLNPVHRAIDPVHRAPK